MKTLIKLNYLRFMSATMILLFLTCNVYAQTTSDMLERVLPSVVTVAVYETSEGKRPLGFRGSPSDVAYDRPLDLSGARSSGSGFVVVWGEKKFIITNAHVIEDASDKAGSIYVFSINRSKYEVRVVGGDSFYDLAVLSFKDSRLMISDVSGTFIPISESDPASS